VARDKKHKAERIAREAEGYYELQLFDEALDRADHLLGLGRQVPFAEAIRAECLRSLERYDEGADAFEQILKVDPANVPA
jgi:tetratricopeptide (TPR) repeat protein